MRVSFVPVGLPHVDFLMVHKGNRRLRHHLPPALRESAAHLPEGCQLFISEAAAAMCIPEDFTLVAGVARVGSKLLLGPHAVPSSHLSQELIGACFAIQRRGQAIEVRSDFLGMLPLFWIKLGETSLCSNRLHLIGLAARAAGHRLNLDLRYVAAGTISDSAWCVQIGTRFLPFEGVNLLRPREEIRFSRRGMRIRPAPVIERRVLEPEEYQALIGRGAEEIAANLSATIDAAKPSYLRADLTGGRDSRIMLAGIVALGRIPEVRFGTADLGDAADVNVASGLAEHFGARFSSEPNGPMHPISAGEVLNFNRSILFGLYHDLRLYFSRPVDRSPQSSILIGGGCGELYRDFWQKVLRSKVDLSSTQGMGRALSNYFQNMSDVPSSRHQKKAARLLGREIKKIEGETLDQKLDMYYLNFRNRLHFGLAGTIGSLVGTAIFHPLASPALLAAARGLPTQDKAMGRVIFDVTRELCPVLPYMPYSGALWPDMTKSRYHRPSVHDGTTPELKPGRDLWEAARRDLQSEPTTRQATPKEAVLARIEQSLPDMVAFVREHGGEAAAIIPTDILERTRASRVAGTKVQLFWYSRIAAIADVMDI